MQNCGNNQKRLGTCVPAECRRGMRARCLDVLEVTLERRARVALDSVPYLELDRNAKYTTHVLEILSFAHRHC